MTPTPEQVIANIREASEAGPYEGPWTVEEFQHDGRPCALIVSAGGTIIAEIRGYIDSCGNGENARFIAACNPLNISVLLGALQSAADTPSPQTHVTVTPLVWRTLDNGTAWSNMTPVGLMYHATEYGWQYRNGNLNPTDGVEAAKAAAQADYVARIRAAVADSATEDGR